MTQEALDEVETIENKIKTQQEAPDLIDRPSSDTKATLSQSEVE